MRERNEKRKGNRKEKRKRKKAQLTLSSPMAFWINKLYTFNLGKKTFLTSSQATFSWNLSTSAPTSKHRCRPDPGADPGINYEGQVGVHKSVNIVTKGEGGAQLYSTICNKVCEGGVHVPPCPLDSLVGSR